jgi:prepilin-type N-terminal cleavage/methylation domain-containing protein
VKKAMTLIELVLVIAIVGILSAVIAPSFQRDSLQEAANQVISHIRYTQHLAMIDNKFNPQDSTWFKDRWQIQFVKAVDGEDVWAYTIYSDTLNHNKNPNIGDTIASDPLNPVRKSATGSYLSGLFLSGGFNGTIGLTHNGRNKSMALQETFGIQDVVFSNSCSYYNSKRILFDTLGRPYYNYKGDSVSTSANPYKDMRILRAQCTISLCLNNPCDSEKIDIAIEPETGYTHIL